MSEHGFYHSDLGYWQAIEDPSDEVRASYPEGTVEVPIQPGAGYTWDGSQWIAPGPDAVTAVLLPLTARQLRLGLLAIGIKPADVATAIAALPENQRDAAEIEWEYASEYRRDHALIATLGTAFGLTAEQVDAAWLAAAAL